VTVSPWLPLLRDLTTQTRTWAVWKSPKSALTGDGDVDSVAAEPEWPIVVRQFHEWARAQGVGPVIRCTHFSGLLILVACAGEKPTRLRQLDVYSRHLFRGSALVTAEELVPLARLEARGFRRLRPGAEGLLLLLRGLPRGGRALAPAARMQILELLRSDPAGAEELAALLRFPAAVLQAFEAGDWDRRAALAFEVRAASRFFLHPAELRACVALDYRRLRGCSLVESLQQGRRVEGDRSTWLSQIARTHRVDEPTAPTS
jgi:hypothetical protein